MTHSTEMAKSEFQITDVSPIIKETTYFWQRR